MEFRVTIFFIHTIHTYLLDGRTVFHVVLKQTSRGVSLTSRNCQFCHNYFGETTTNHFVNIQSVHITQQQGESSLSTTSAMIARLAVLVGLVLFSSSVETKDVNASPTLEPKMITYAEESGPPFVDTKGVSNSSTVTVITKLTDSPVVSPMTDSPISPKTDAPISDAPISDSPVAVIEKLTVSPISSTTDSPTLGPISPTTDSPTLGPTQDPTLGPTQDPTLGPTQDPTLGPTQNPTQNPSSSPEPTQNPSSLQEPTQNLNTFALNVVHVNDHHAHLAEDTLSIKTETLPSEIAEPAPSSSLVISDAPMLLYVLVVSTLIIML